MSTPDQESMPWPNLANEIRDYLTSRWGWITKLHYAWFTGSSVWSFLYGIEPSKEADLDVFVELPDPIRQDLWRRWQATHPQPPITTLSELQTGPSQYELAMYTSAPIKWLEDQLKLDPAYTTETKAGSIGGKRCTTSLGKIDYWVCGGDAILQLINYPLTSHAHCRAAYSFYRNTLLVLPNSCATEQGAIEANERRMLWAGGK